MDEARTILGIESSCDDTAAAIVRARPGAPVGAILASVVAGQDALHDPYGGDLGNDAAVGVVERVLAGDNGGEDGADRNAGAGADDRDGGVVAAALDAEDGAGLVHLALPGLRTRAVTIVPGAGRR